MRVPKNSSSSVNLSARLHNINKNLTKNAVKMFFHSSHTSLEKSTHCIPFVYFCRFFSNSKQFKPFLISTCKQTIFKHILLSYDFCYCYSSAFCCFCCYFSIPSFIYVHAFVRSLALSHSISSV